MLKDIFGKGVRDKIQPYFNQYPRLLSISMEFFGEIIYLDDKQSNGTYWVLLFTDRHMAMYFDSFEIEYIPQEVLNKIKEKSIAHNIFRI